MEDKKKMVSLEVADIYQGLFNYMLEQHNVTLTISEMGEIRNECMKIEQGLQELFSK